MDLSTRSSGVLLPISSLPGPAGTGALGRSARSFADFLARSGQAWWQMLPVNPIDLFNSPYSTCSAFAGEPLYLDLEEFVAEKLLEPSDLTGVWQTTENERLDRSDYARAIELRRTATQKAFENFRLGKGGKQYRDALPVFRQENEYWLDDYTRYMAFVRYFKTTCWNEWPEPFRTWNTTLPAERVLLLNKCTKEYPDSFWQQVEEDREYAEFLQLVFDVQWREFKEYCHSKGVSLLGDVPIYVGLAGADTWSRPDLFQMTKDGRMTRVAGVPPDAFNPDGQRWDSPLYDWDRHEENGFDWWIHRIRQALKRYDALRLDHFIGFYNYYSFPTEGEEEQEITTVPVSGSSDLPDSSVEEKSESAAENFVEDLTGEVEKVVYEKGWRPGPQKKLFNALFAVFSKERFLAEDLGVLNPGVHRLRNYYGLPGMKVFQFEFDHRGRIDPTELWEENSVACTGTHDTPTLIEWLSTLEKTGPYHWIPTNFAHVWHVLLKYQEESEKVTMDFSTHTEEYLPEYDFWRYSAVSPEVQAAAAGGGLYKVIPETDPPVRRDIVSLRNPAIRAVMNSSSRIALFPMQDIFGLGPSARMNFPGKEAGNWNWRLNPSLLTEEVAARLRQLTEEGRRSHFSNC